MSPFLLVLIGMAIVLCGVLVFKLHAFLALIIAAMIVAALTPTTTLKNEITERQAIGKIVRVLKDSTHEVELSISKMDGVERDTLLSILQKDKMNGRYFDFGGLRIDSITPGTDRERVKIIGSFRVSDYYRTFPHMEPPMSPEWLNERVGNLLIFPAQRKAALSPTIPHIAQRVAEGFGRTCIDIGILIALAAIIGECLLASGAAERIVRSILRLVGEKRASSAFLGSGFLLGIPVFFDTVFYLLVPLAKAMRMKTGKHYLLYVLTIVAGATMTHSLVPPTPGPLYAASAFKVDVGVMILGGLAVSAITACVGYAYAVWADRRWDIPLRDTAEGGVGDLQVNAQKDDASLPPLWLSLLPIVLPVALIAGSAVVETWRKSLGEGQSLPAVIEAIGPPLWTLGDKNIAILLAAVIAMVTMALHKRGEKGAVGRTVNIALTGGGMVILITAAGGAFGAVLRQTGIAGEIQGLAQGWHVAVLPLAFLVTALVRTAQGSATVAMITAAAIFAPIVEGDTLSFHPLYLALAVGCGSKPIMWMNDSGFWVITKMTGFKEIETLRTATIMMILMALAGLMVVMAGAMALPMKM